MSKYSKKIGILTLDGYFNYGNRLQNFALQEVVKKFGFEVETLVIPRKDRHPKHNKENKLLRLLKQPPAKTMKQVLHKFSLYSNKQAIQQKSEIFKHFSKTNLSERFCDITKEPLQNVGRDYDYLIVGSDQVWNPYNIIHAEDAFFLTFVEPAKRISYAASFGITELPNYFKDMITPWLSQMKAISVREYAGAKIVKELTARDAEVLLDPTLLLSKQEWLAHAKGDRRPDKKFLLTYFLGEKPKDAAQLISDLRKDYGFEVVNLADVKDLTAYQTGPQEFIDYINSAELVLTDSFHGMAFSVLMETPFVVYERIGSISMYSRIETLLRKLQLLDRVSTEIRIKKDLFGVNFKESRILLSNERQRASSYLEKALDGGQGEK